MSRPNPVKMLAVLAAFAALLAGLELASGAVLVDRYDGDMLHLVDLVTRLASGELPHRDFMTPIGVLAIAPMALFLDQGPGHAILFGQMLVAALLLLPGWYVGTSRFPGAWGGLFGAAVIVLALALVHGEADQVLTVSMHYNRWAWALAFLGVALGYLPARGRARPVLDGALLGAVMAALVLLKVTYVVAFAPPVAVMLALRGARRELAVGVAVALALLGLATLILGPGHWPAYLRDLLAVAGSEGRQYPTQPLTSVLAAPAYLPATALGLAAVVLLRQGGASRAGLGLLLLLPGCIYATYQNFGNDPQWLLLAGLLLLAWRGQVAGRNRLGWDLRGALGLAAAGMLAFTAPSWLNMALSPVQTLTADRADYAPEFSWARDLLVADSYALRADLIVPGDGPGSGLAWAADLAERDPQPAIPGAPLKDCTLRSGIAVWMRAVSEDLVAAGYAGKRVLPADLLTGLWLFDPALPPVPGAAPWSYGTGAGFAAADYLLVPDCAISVKARNAWLDLLAERGVALREVRHTPLYRLLERDGG